MRVGLLTIALLLSGAGAAADTPATAIEDGRAPAGGIWKAVVPPKEMKGEFGNLDPVGVAVGAKIPADCSINWISPDDGARYCFSSGTSLEFFLDRPHYYIARARIEWHKMGAQR